MTQQRIQELNKHVYLLELNSRKPVHGSGGRYRLQTNGTLSIRQVGSLTHTYLHLYFKLIFICGKMKYKIKPVVVTPSVIRQVGEDDEGLYLCEAENGVSDPLGKLVGLKINSK